MDYCIFDGYLMESWICDGYLTVYSIFDLYVIGYLIFDTSSMDSRYISRQKMFYILVSTLYRRFELSHVFPMIDLEEAYRLVSKNPNFMPRLGVAPFCVYL